MPEAQSPKGDNTQALQPDAGAVIPRMSLGEQGVVGLRVSNKRIFEEVQAAFRWPAFINTVNEMRNNPTVGAAMNVWRMMISRVRWDVAAPEGADETAKARAAAVKSMMDDMDGSWATFIEEVVPYLEYGFDIHEIVLRRRLKRNGSKHDDGLVGIKKLAPRSQETIAGWVFSDDGAELLAVKQSMRTIVNSGRFAKRTDPADGLLTMDREKILLFAASATKGNPEGNSIYKNIYLAFKQLALLQDQELLGITKDVQGMLKIAIPAKYMAPDASPEDKAVYEGFKQIIDNYNAGTQAGLLVPLVYDTESKLPLFDYSLMEAKGSAKYDTSAVIKRLQSDILSALCVDILKLGADGAGSFSLAESKSSVLALAIDYRLREIAEVLNSHLMRLIYEMNGWDASITAKFVYADIEDVSLEEFSKAIQRIVSVNAVELDRAFLNRVRKVLGLQELPDDAPVDKESLPANMVTQTTGAGAGMEIGTTGEGTSKKPGGQDKSAKNASNKG